MREKVKDFFEQWSHIKETLKGKDLFLFLDYDGTLTPIVETPAEAVLAPEVKAMLDRLRNSEHCHLTIVSGRALSDLRQRVGLKKIIYVGNHGFEVYGPDINWKNGYFPKSRQVFSQILDKLSKTLASMPEVLIEDKRITLSLHVRRLEADKKPLFKKSLYKTVMPYVRLKDIHLREGKEVYELRPPVAWDKGKAVLWLLQGFHDKSVLPIYIGDDQTDEDAFIALKDIALTIHVGNGETTAQYSLKDTTQVKLFLAKILEVQAAERAKISSDSDNSA
ncbi:MAG: trehalose-phosphatase [Candidatus Omnitrophica bacterium]|nr:trehalose-phosphatase [Candidatus Omnitrophota bacterium]